MGAVAREGPLHPKNGNGDVTVTVTQPEGDVQVEPLEKPKVLDNFVMEVDEPHIGLKCWLRLPNPWQHQQIHGLAQAARTLMVRQLRDPDSTAALGVEGRLYELEELPEDVLRRQLADMHLTEQMAKAQLYIETENHPEFQQFRSMDDVRRIYDHHRRSDTMDSEQAKEAVKMINDFAVILKRETERLMEPFEVKYGNMEQAQLVETMRRSLCKEVADAAFMEEYNRRQIFFGTRKFDDHNKNYFDSYEELVQAEGPVVIYLTEQFAKMEMVRGAEAKKSVAATLS